MIRRYSADFVAVALAALWLLVWRWLLGTPWGLQPQITAEGLLNIGILYNPGDTWSYLSWVQQYAHDASLAGLLYTTEPHPPLLWLFPLWLVGHVAAWTGLPALGVYNLAGFLGALTAVFLFRRAAGALRLSHSAVNWSTFALLVGSGGSWLWHLASKLHLVGRADGGDLYFLDLFPSTTFLAYAYHAMSLALLAGLWWCVTEVENRLIIGTKAGGWLAAMAILALLLGFSRPYEPIAFLGAWLLKTVWHCLRRKQDATAWKTSLLLAVLLGTALLPGIGWTFWVSRQPVWSSFASDSLALGLPRSAWLWTLAGWAILVVTGAPLAWRTDRRLAILPLAATILFAAILFGMGGGYSKLASGLILGPILLAGWGAARIVSATSRLPTAVRVSACGAGLAALLGIGSFHLVTHTIHLRGPELVDPALVALAGGLPQPPGARAVTVLADGGTGAILPGLVGARVWVGHWSLSPHYKTKIARLQQAGLDPRHLPPEADAVHAALAGVLADAAFDFALVDVRCQAAIAWMENHGWKRLAREGSWILLRPLATDP